MRKSCIVLAACWVVGCIAIEGPCRVEQGAIVCKQGGKAVVFKPDTTIGELKDDRDDDPRITIPPRMRN